MMCMSCVLACQMSPQTEIRKAIVHKDPKAGTKVHLNISDGTPWLWRCRQCLSAPCEEACFTGGLQKSKDSVIEQQAERCVSCGSCYLSCPLEGIHMTKGDQPPLKCDLCGSEREPLCVQVCPSKALEFETSFKSNRKKQLRYAKKIKYGR